MSDQGAVRHSNIIGKWRQDRYFGLVVVAIAFLVYANSLTNGFVWDDTNVIVTNPELKGLPLALFSSIDAGRDFDLLPYYRPLTILTFLIEERLHGLNPFPMHLINVLLHAFNALLVYFLARALTDDSKTALLAGLLFAVHPINTEAVDFISGGRNTMLSCFFILMAYLFYRRGIISGSISTNIAGAAFFGAGLFSKETALMILPLIMAQEIIFLRKKASGSRFRAATRLLPYVAATAGYIFMRWATLSKLGIQTSILPGFGSGKLLSMYKIPDIWTRLGDNLYIFPRYMLTIVWPAALSPRYIIPDSFSTVALPLAAAWICIISIIVWLLTKGRSMPVLFGLVWGAAFYLPVSGIVIFPSSPMADRYMYIPAIGLWIVVAEQMRKLLTRKEVMHKYGIIALAVVLLVVGGITVRRNTDWKSDMTLFTRFAEQYPDNVFAHAGLAEAYFNRNRQDVGDLMLAEAEFKKVLALKPVTPPGIHSRLGYIRHALGDYEGAVNYYTIALGIYPLDKEALLNRAIALESLERQKEALADFERFLSIPGYELADARPYAESRVRILSK